MVRRHMHLRLQPLAVLLFLVTTLPLLAEERSWTNS